MPSELFKPIFLLLVGAILGTTLLNLLGTQSELIASWCLILTVHRSAG